MARHGLGNTQGDGQDDNHDDKLMTDMGKVAYGGWLVGIISIPATVHALPLINLIKGAAGGEMDFLHLLPIPKGFG